MRIDFQYLLSANSSLSGDLNIIQIDPQTLEIQPFKKDHFFNFSENEHLHE